MPVTPHVEKHFTASAVIKDVVIGMADGLTVPFALAAGLSGAVAANDLVVTAGAAEIAAGAIAMGLGGYLAAKSDADHYASERRRERMEVEHFEHKEVAEVIDIFRHYGLSKEDCAPIIAGFKKNPEAWVDFMMRYELGLEKPDPRRALVSAATIGGAYIIGGLIPLLPYIFFAKAHTALLISMAVTLLALFVFGYIKARFTGVNRWRGAFQTTFVGGLASAVAFFVANAIG